MLVGGRWENCVGFGPSSKRKSLSFNEPGGILATIDLLKTLTCKPVNKGYTIIPYVNPWGYDNRSRLNRMNCDVNRDFRDPGTQEALVIARYLSGKRFDLVLDLHEDPYDSKGYYLYCLSSGRAIFEKAEKVIHQILNLGFPIENKMKIFPFRTRSGIITIPYWASYITKIVNRLAFCNYSRTMGISRNIVVTETPTFIPLEERVELQLLSIETLTDLNK